MNDEPSSSTAHGHLEDGPDKPEAAAAAAELAERRKKNRQMFNRKRGDLLDDLLRNLDILVYAELSAIYYMDCSFLRFLIRAFVQFMFLSPKPPLFPEHPQDKPIIGALFGSNLICLFFHIIFAPPSAGEATRGYLHGGLAMDFIGQKGPTSKTHLLLLDMFIVVLQLVQLSSSMTRRRLKDASTSASASTSSTATANATETSTESTQTTSEPAQDLDSEERGVRRADEQHDIEMQTLNASGAAASTSTDEPVAESSERDSLLATTAPRTDAYIFDAFDSGQIVLADLDVLKQIKHQVKLARTTSRETIPASQALRAELAGRILRMRLNADALRQTI